MKNTNTLVLLFTGIYEWIVIKSVLTLNTCQLPFSAGYVELEKHATYGSNIFHWENQFCNSIHASLLQTLILCVGIPLFFWTALISIRSIKHYLSFWATYEVVVITSIYNISSCLIPFGSYPRCYITPTPKQYVLLCVVVPMAYLLLMVWKKELDNCNILAEIKRVTKKTT